MRKRIPRRGIIYAVVAGGAGMVVVSQRDTMPAWIGWVGIAMIFAGALALRYAAPVADDGPGT